MTELTIAFSLTCLAVVAWLAGAIGLPGNWLILLLATGCYWLATPGEPLWIPLSTLFGIIAICLVGEILEWVAGAMGVRRLGGSARSATLALVGSVIGGVLGLIVGSGVPIIGNVIASLAGSALGACVGSLYGERSAGKSWEHSMQIGSVAFFGRIAGTLLKLICGTLLLVIFVCAIWF